MSATQPQPLDHEAIMALIRGRSADFRAASPVVPAAGFNPAPTLAAALKSALAEGEGAAGETLPPPPSRPAGPSADFIAGQNAARAEVEAARAEAFDAGRAAGRAEAEAEIAQAQQDAIGQASADERAALARALDNLGRAEAAQLAELEQVMAAAIFILAAERAGQAIDTAPAPFMARIKSMAARLGTAAQGLSVTLHPDDLAAIQPHLARDGDLSAARLMGDGALMRGDIRLAGGGLGLVDLLGEGRR